jgi:hypothetical protein
VSARASEVAVASAAQLRRRVDLRMTMSFTRKG